MRKLILFILCLILLILFCSGIKRKKQTFEETLAYRINTSSLKIYHNSALDYVLEYPDFFQKESCREDHLGGYVRFSFWKIGLECYVVQNKGEDLKTFSDSMALMEHAVVFKRMRNSFILSGEVYSEEYSDEGYICDVSGECCYAKYVRRGGYWLVCKLYYPEGYRIPLMRLVRLVTDWKPHRNTASPSFIIRKM